jgi:DNA-binding response OmpR family regulator
MSTPPHILSVGKDPSLMSSRTMLLLNAGYAVQEAFPLDKAKDLVRSDSIDVTLFCHTVPERDQRLLIYLVRAKRRLMPILRIRSHHHESVPLACIAVDNEPEALLQTLKSVVQSPGALGTT